MTWKHLCSAAKLEEGEPLGFKLGEQRVALYKVGDEVFATDDVCSHAFALLSSGFLEGHVIECPLHGAMFDVRSGKCRSSTYKDITTFPVEIRDGEVYVRLDGGAALEPAGGSVVGAKS
ncbi:MULTISPECIES: non-heme iron oxygenase ferredoxin subunit [Bradyrhizobium]|uniref:non-heme iron oxygenase ferredoxin subunit n=1 Tax=Bradyrhizobium TaxID=374 RepID=UPI0010B1CB8B|nr:MULTISPECIES: non-heme iron oxygenase ferredoxin subunit [Bradyrhizobium]QOZ25101.1 non-heme iron oxygenase ferredoxin subunit [Bradyrhizobium sp. CCBAU 51753]VIO71964.1 Naphthalene 1,2-dioxygenase/salicylate 5-hydroxylase systems, ferredoxin component [Bradyrhizobium ivorense]